MNRVALRSVAVVATIGAVVPLCVVGARAAAPAGWRSVDVPFQHRHHGASYTAVSCWSGRSCYLLGSAGPNAPVLSVRYRDGQLTALPGPRLPGVTTNLLGLACRSGRFCVAVGDRDARGGEVPVAEMWNGARWSAMPLPSARLISRAITGLSAVACPSDRMCIAVGDRSRVSRTVSTPIVDRWNGVKWSAERTPVSTASLSSVACASTVACTVVGDGFSDVHGGPPIAMRLAGTHWSRVKLPSGHATTGLALNAVSCPSPNSCVAVGERNRSTNFGHGRIFDVSRAMLLTAHDGRWTEAVPPPPRSIVRAGKGRVFDSELEEISCPPADVNGCIAFGGWFDNATSDSAGLSIALRPGGLRQQLLPVDGQPDAISCPTARFCLAVGSNSIIRSTH